MVLCASGVTNIRHLAVGGPITAGLVSNKAPADLISRVKTVPNLSFFTRPIKPPLLPSCASPASVFATEPPEVSRPEPISKQRLSACISSIRVMLPFFKKFLSRKESSVCTRTSTIA